MYSYDSAGRVLKKRLRIVNPQPWRLDNFRELVNGKRTTLGCGSGLRLD